MYLLEGNIGSGKSTFLQLIKQHISSVKTVTEPVAAWHHSEHGQSLLGQFYADQKRWSYTMETFTLITRVHELLKEQETETNLPKIMERSIYSGYYCFAKNGYTQGAMNPLEWKAYSQWFNFLVEKKCHTPTGFIYLKTSPEVCFERMNKRNRSGEEAIPLAYLQQIHESHESFLVDKKDILPALTAVPVLILNVSEEFALNPTVFMPLLEQVKNFIMITQPHCTIAQQKLPIIY